MGRGGLAAAPAAADPSRREGGGLLPRLPRSHPCPHKPASTEPGRGVGGGEALGHPLCQKIEVPGALHGRAHPTTGHGGPMPRRHQTPHHSRVHGPAITSGKDSFPSKPFCSWEFLPESFLVCWQRRPDSVHHTGRG